MTNTAERDDLVARIAGLAARAADPEYLPRFNPASSRYRIARLTQVGGIPREELDALGRDLARYFGLDPDGHIFVRSSPAGAGSWQSRLMSSRLVARARFEDAGAVLTEYENAFNTNAAEVREVVAIWGLHPPEQLEIRAGIFLTPLSRTQGGWPGRGGDRLPLARPRSDARESAGRLWRPPGVVGGQGPGVEPRPSVSGIE
jgi:hypothetical protein